jgi:MFS family permease
MTGFCFIQLATGTAIMCIALFIPFIAKDYGASTATIGLLVALYNGMVFVSSILFGRWADLKGGKAFILAGLLLSSVAFFLHSFVSSIQSLFLVRCLAGFAVGMFPAALFAHVYSKKLNLGVFVASGSLGWGLGSIIAGVIAVYRDMFLLSGVCFFLAFIVAIFAIKQEPARIRQPFFDTSVLRRNWRLYLGFFLRHCGAFNIWVLFPLFLAELGASRLWIGAIHGINPLGQVLFMPLVARIPSSTLIRLGFCCSAITFMGFSICRTFLHLIPFQILLAFSWSCLYLGSMKYLMERNEERSTSAGIFHSLFSLAGIVGALIGGFTATLGYRTVMITAVLFTLAGFLVFIGGKRH